jgi:hypothetical protein
MRRTVTWSGAWALVSVARAAAHPIRRSYMAKVS